MKRYCLLFIVAIAVSGCVEPPPNPTSAAPSKVEFLTFGAEWCGPCKTQKPVIERLKKDFSQVTFRTIDIDQEPTVANTFRIQGVPTMLILVDGRETQRFVGTETQANLTAALNRHLPKPAKQSVR